MANFSFWGINAKVSAITRRFPIPVIFATLTTLFLIWLVDQESDHLFRWPITGFLGFLAALNWDLFCIPRKISGWKYASGMGLILLGLVLYLHLAASHLTDDSSCFWFVTAGISIVLHLSVSLAPFTMATPKYNIVSFSIRTCIVWMQSFLFSSLLLSALSLALLALNMLFGWEPAPTAYLKLFILVTGLFQTPYFLAELPSLEEQNYQPSQKSVFKFLVSYGAIPVTILYGIIVHTYIFKVIIFRQDLVDWYQTMALWYLGFGALTWLLGLLFEGHSDNALLSIFRKWFLPFCIVPAAVLTWSVVQQMQEVTVQEQWYTSLYFTALALGFLLIAGFKGSEGVRSIPLWFILVTALTFFSGKYSICTFPVIAEQQQLIEVLTEQQILRKDTLYEPSAPLADTNGVITAGLEYLGRKKALGFIREFDKMHLLDSLPEPLKAIDMITFFHVDTYNDFVDDRYWEYNRRNKEPISISGFDRLIPVFYDSEEANQRSVSESLLCRENGLASYISGRDTLARIDIRPLLMQLAKHPNQYHDTLIVTPGYTMRIVPQNATGRLEGNQTNITSFSALVMVNTK